MYCGLKEVLRKEHIQQQELANYLGISKTAVSLLVNKGLTPSKANNIKKDVDTFLNKKGINTKGLWQDVEEPTIEDDENNMEKCIMLTQKARKQFKVAIDPFTADIQDSKDVYLSESSRYVFEYMYLTAKNGGLLAVVGESGSGKTTLRRMMIDRITHEELKIKVISPKTIDKGRLTAGAICDAIINDCSQERPKRSLEAKSRQVERVLTNSSRSGYSHVLIIEEAHDLTIPVLKYLKRFWELEDGFKKLIGIILVAQQELKTILDESRNYTAREIIRRIEIAELAPFLSPEELKGYLSLKFKRVNVNIEDVFEENVYPTIIKKMTRKTLNNFRTSSCYPLNVNNLIKQAMNTAAQVGQEKVDEETILALK